MIRSGSEWYNNKVKSLQRIISSTQGNVRRKKGNVTYYKKLIERWTIELNWLLKTWKSPSIQKYFVKKQVRRVVVRRNVTRKVNRNVNVPMKIKVTKNIRRYRKQIKTIKSKKNVTW